MRILNEWEAYKKAVMPANVGPVQLTETRRAFYAGATALMSILHGLPDDIDGDAGAVILEEMWQECKAFKELVKIGRA